MFFSPIDETRGAMKREIAALLLIMVTAIGFYYLVTADMNAIPKFVITVLLLLASSFSLQGLLKIEGEYGLLLVRTTKGLDTLDKIARLSPRFWKTVADAGLVFGYGISSIFIFKELPRKTFIISLLSLIIVSQLILPATAPLALELFPLPMGSRALSFTSGQADPLIALVLYLIYLSLLFGGVALFAIAGVMLHAFRILFVTAVYLLSVLQQRVDGGVLQTIGPGAGPVLPGITIPFVEGIIALAVLLVVHECAHGILARAERIALRSAGLVFFGILPFGAFVDPDEKQLQRAKEEKQHRVLVAGSTANIITGIAVFFLLALFSWWALSAYPNPEVGKSYVVITGVLANSSAEGHLSAGMRIIEWNGHRITSIQDFAVVANKTKEDDIVNVTTDAGSFSLRAGAGGKVGVMLGERSLTLGGWLRELSERGVWLPLFLFNLLALTFVLNILIGIVNLLPIPPFDGYRIAALVIRNETVMKAIVITIVVFFLVNFLPWAWV